MKSLEKYILYKENISRLDIKYHQKKPLQSVKIKEALSTGRIESLVFVPVKFQELSRHDFSLLYKKLMITEDKNLIQKLTPNQDFTHYKDNNLLIEDNKFFFQLTKFSSLL